MVDLSHVISAAPRFAVVSGFSRRRGWMVEFVVLIKPVSAKEGRSKVGLEKKLVSSDGLRGDDRTREGRRRSERRRYFGSIVKGCERR